MTWLPPQNASDSISWSTPQREGVPFTTAATHDATWSRRLGGVLIDVALAVCCFFLTFILAGVFAGIAGTTSQQDDAIVLPVAWVIAPLLAFGLPVVLAARRGDANGQTLGKQAVGLRAVRTDGRPVGLGTALVRELFAKGLLSLTVLWVVLDAIFPFTNARGQALHDKLASTVVVPAQANASASAESAGAMTSAGR